MATAAQSVTYTLMGAVLSLQPNYDPRELAASFPLHFIPVSEHRLHTCPHRFPVLPPGPARCAVGQRPVEACGACSLTRRPRGPVGRMRGRQPARSVLQPTTAQPHARGHSPKWVIYSPQGLIEGKLAADWKERFWLPTRVTLNEGDECDIC